MFRTASGGRRAAKRQPPLDKASLQAIVLDGFKPEQLRWNNLDGWVVGWIGVMHLGALAAPFFFSWSAVAVTAVLYWITGCIGVTLGYHRYLSHRSFKLSRPAQFVVYLCGCLSAEGSPLSWTATHRLHHSRSDQEGDPHSPTKGAWWSHLLWLFIRQTKAHKFALHNKYAPDLVNDPMLQFFERTFIVWSLLLAGGLYALGGWSWLLWGMCLRSVLVYHSTWFVNSATHLWGYRNYETKDMSRNLWWVALLTHGEGWHNNHHAYPRIARAGHRWWEVDTTYWVICLLRWCGQATDVCDRLPQAKKTVPVAAVVAVKTETVAVQDRVRHEEAALVS